MRKLFWLISTSFFFFHVVCLFLAPWLLFLSVFTIPQFVLGVSDINQKKHTIRKNFPVIGHMRYILEMIRPEISQYFRNCPTSMVMSPL